MREELEVRRIKIERDVPGKDRAGRGRADAGAGAVLGDSFRAVGAGSGFGVRSGLPAEPVSSALADEWRLWCVRGGFYHSSLPFWVPYCSPLGADECNGPGHVLGADGGILPYAPEAAYGVSNYFVCGTASDGRRRGMDGSAKGSHKGTGRECHRSTILAIALACSPDVLCGPPSVDGGMG